MAKSLKGVLKLVYPIEKGKINDFGGLEKIFHNQFYTNLRVDPAEKDVALVIPPALTLNNIQKLVEIMLDTFNVKSISIIPEPVAISIYNNNLNSIILQCGYSYIYLARIKNGLLSSSSVKTYDYGMMDVAEYFRRLTKIEKQQLDNDGIISILLEYGKVSMDLESESFEEIEYTLPNGEIIRMGEELSVAPEILFRPNLIGKEEDGLIQIVKEYMREYGDSLKIIGSGGCFHLNGFVSRLERMIEKKIIIPEEATYQEWKGASLLMKKGYIKSINRSDYMANEKFLLNYIPII